MAATKIMGILNVTPDSFSDGGLFDTTKSALARAEQLIDDGADILDIGGESTRPFAEAVSLNHELSRTIPVIKAIRNRSAIPISIDTTKAEVARQAVQAGADIVNDISAVRKDSAMLDFLKNTEVPVIIMHMQNNPEDMQINPKYNDVVEEIIIFFRERLEYLGRNGISPSRITIDPGIGFGKTVAHNLSILKHLTSLKSLNCPVLLGHSRKRFIGEITAQDIDNRDHPTAIISALAAMQGVNVVRVHDVKKTKTALLVAEAVRDAI